MIRPIVRDVFFLSQKSEPATQADLAVDRDLRDTLQANRERCVGMAANMIGVRKRVIIVSLGFADTVMYNPVLLSKDTPYHFKRNWKAAKLLLLLLTASVWTITIAHAEPAPVTVTGRPEESVSGPEYAYDLSGAHEVDGRQGVAWEDSCFYISGSTTLTKYDADWNLIAAAENPFSGFSDEVNHIGDIDVYNGELYAGVEFFMDGEAKNIQIAVYDALTLELTRTYPFAGESGQNEVSGIAVDPDSGSIWLCSWADGESGRYLYRYDLNTGDYIGKFHLQAPPQWIQGVAYRDGWLYLTADDGTADLGEPDHVYRCRVDVSKTAWTVLLERTLDDVTLQGEIEGITFTDSQMLISYNRGTRIVLGMPKGFYEGYDQEIHEVFDYTMKVYDILRRGAGWMKYSIDTYPLYKDEKRFAFVVRAKVRMKDSVDVDVLRLAANKAIKRYPYFSVKVQIDESGSYVRVPNDKEIAVLPIGEKTPFLCSQEVNEHLLFLEADGKDIYFNISHTMCGGRGLQPWIMTTVWQYIADKYGVEPLAPSIRKPGEPLLEGEMDEPALDTLPKEEPIYEYKSKNPKVLIADYMNGLFNPFMRNSNYRVLTFSQKELLSFAKGNDASVAAFFLITVAKALDKVLPEKAKVIGGEIAHNMAANIGLKNAHCDILSHIHIDYTRDQLKMDMEKLGTMTRGQIILQTDPSVSCKELRQKLELYEKLDGIHGIKAKRKYMKEHDPSTGKDAKHGTYYVNYTGQMDWGEVADYIESFVLIVEGHVMLEVTSAGDKIFVCFMQILDNDKYINAFREVMNELGISFTMEGPYPKKLPKHQLPGNGL